MATQSLSYMGHVSLSTGCPLSGIVYTAYTLILFVLHSNIQAAVVQWLLVGG